MRRRFIGIAMLIAALSSSPADGQPVPESSEAVWLVGGSVGLPGYEREVEPSLFTVAFHASYLRENSIGVETFLGTMPRLVLEGLMVLGARANIVAALGSSTGFLLLPTAGASFVGGSGAGGTAADIGLNVGVGFMTLNDASTGLRIGVTWHRFGQGGISPWLLEFGFVR